MVSKLKRVLSSLLVCSMFSTFAATSVSADVLTIDYDSTVAGSSAKSYQSVSVELEKAEVYSVTLPKSVVLDGTSDSTSLNYNVTATGEISSVHYVRVIPLAGSKLYNEDETVSLDLNVTLDKHRWDNTEILTSSGSNDTTGVMSVDSIEPGKWTGKIRFLVTLDDSGEWLAATCTSPATCIGYDTNDDGVLSEDEKLATPVTKGKPLGHKFAGDSHAFPDTCERCKQMVYVISTAEQLTAFRDAVNNDGNAFAGATVELGADIDMSSESWDTGIGKQDGSTYKTFKGTFDGNGYKIIGLHINSSADTPGSYTMTNACGLFNFINSSGVILRNFTLEDVSVARTVTGYTIPSFYVGALVGYTEADVVFDNVFLRDVNVQAKYDGTYDSMSMLIGTFIGRIESGAKCILNNCAFIDCSTYATGNIGTTISSGGIVGYVVASNGLTMNNCLCGVTNTVGTAKSYSLDCIALRNTANSESKPVLNNCVINTEVTQATVGTAILNNCLQGTTAECQSQAAIDILNTDNTETCVLDLEGLNKGYPLIK